MTAFEDASWRDLERRAKQHLLSCFPNECEQLGEAGLEEFVRYGIKRARAHGFESEYDILRYLNLSVVLGSDFDEDESYPWAAEILSSDEFSARTRMDLLTEMATQELSTPEDEAKGAAVRPDWVDTSAAAEGKKKVEFDGLVDSENGTSIDASVAAHADW